MSIILQMEFKTRKQIIRSWRWEEPKLVTANEQTGAAHLPKSLAEINGSRRKSSSAQALEGEAYTGGINVPS